MKNKKQKLWVQRYHIKKLSLKHLGSMIYYRIARKQIEANGGLGWDLKRKRVDKLLKPKHYTDKERKV